jgi:hypothetical protein
MAAGPEEATQHPILTALEGGASNGSITGEQVLNEILDLLTDRLPRLALHDPALGAALGRPRAAAVEVPQLC